MPGRRGHGAWTARAAPSRTELPRVFTVPPSPPTPSPSASILEMRKDHEEQLQRLKLLKDREIDAVTSATSHTR